MARKTGRLRIGTSGYQYPHWKGRFYAADLPKKAWFDFYAEAQRAHHRHRYERTVVGAAGAAPRRLRTVP